MSASLTGTLDGEATTLQHVRWDHRVVAFGAGRFGGKKEAASHPDSEIRMDADGSIVLGERRFIPDAGQDVESFLTQVSSESLAPAVNPYQSPFEANMKAFTTPLSGDIRFQYAVVNMGSFNTAERMTKVLGQAGEAGWELVTTLDKSSNWWQGFEKGFLLMKRPVPDGVEVESWCLTISMTAIQS